jgi:hypothetical protein
VVAIASGLDHNLALKRDGTVVAWGLNSHGQTNVPSGLSNVVAIAASDNYSLALVRESVTVLTMRLAVAQIPIQSSNGIFRLSLSGLPPTGEVIIEASANLRDWEAVFTNSLPAGAVEFSEAILPGRPCRYYRAGVR